MAKTRSGQKSQRGRGAGSHNRKLDLARNEAADAKKEAKMLKRLLERALDTLGLNDPSWAIHEADPHWLHDARLAVYGSADGGPDGKTEPEEQVADPVERA